MDRLTSKNWQNLDPWECCGQDSFCTHGCHNEGGCTNGCIVPKIYSRLALYESSGLSLERCAELAEAEREGRLIALRVALGEKILCIPSNHCLTVESVDIHDDGSIIYRCGNNGTDDYTAFFDSEFGNRYIIAEAERALEGRRGDA